MLEFIGLISDVLLTPFTIGDVTLNLGAVALGWIMIDQGVDFFHNISGVESINHEIQGDLADEYIKNDRYERRMARLAAQREALADAYEAENS